MNRIYKAQLQNAPLTVFLFESRYRRGARANELDAMAAAARHFGRGATVNLNSIELAQKTDLNMYPVFYGRF